MRRTLIIIILFVSGVLLTSCLQSSFNVQKRFELNYQATSVGRQLVIGNDSLTINDFKFSASAIELINRDSTVIGTQGNVDAIIIGYSRDDLIERLIVSTGFQFEVNDFTNFKMEVDPVPTNATVLDEDFFSIDDNFSLVIRGTFNGRNFELFESPSFDTTFTFRSPVVVTNELETLYILLESDLLTLFTADDGTLLDPFDETDKAQIISNLPHHFSVQAGAITRFIF